MSNRQPLQASPRDIEVLDFIVRFGVVSREAVGIWAQTSPSRTRVRERRLRELGLINVRSGVWGEGRIMAATRPGISLCGRGQLRPARFSLNTLHHDIAVSELAAEIERDGTRTISEREMAVHEREAGERIYSAQLGPRRFHRADLLRLGGNGPPEAIEVELTVKGSSRLDDILRAWRRAVAERRLSRVVYRCPPQTRPVVGRAIKRTSTQATVMVLGL